MDKWRNKGKAVAIREDSLLPPTRRISSVTPPPLLDKRRSKKWSIDGFFKKVSSILDAQSSSSSLEDTSEKQRRKTKGKPRVVTRASGYALRSSEGIDYSPAGVYRTSNKVDNDNDDLLNANTMTSQSLDVLLTTSNNSHSRSSDGSLDGPGRRVRKDKVKARVEAKRDQLCVGDSSMDESSNTEEAMIASKNGQGAKTESNSKRRSRASRTERYLKRMCNGGNGSNGSKSSGTASHNVADSRNLEGRGDVSRVPEEFQPIERVPRSDFAQEISGGYNGNVYPMPCYNGDIPKENFYARQADVGVNPLVQQTLQYFSEFDWNMAATQHKIRKTYPTHQHHRRSHKSHAHHPSNYTMDNGEALLQAHSQSLSSVTPPKPPSRDHRSRILVNGSSLDKYQQMLRHVQRPLDYPAQIPVENGMYARSSLHSPNTEVRNINEGRGFTSSPSSTMHKYHLPLSPPRSPLRDSLNMTVLGMNGTLIERNQPPLLDINKSKYVDQPSPRFLPILQTNDYENSNYVPFKRAEVDKPNERRSSKNLEEALFELEAIYNSLQLGDEDLLERAEKRTMEEFHYKGFTASPDGFDNEDPSSRRKTWGDPALDNFKEEPEIPDRLKDDMAYRRMHPKERPSSVDGQSSLSSISYLMTSPIPSRREMRYIDPKRKPRRKEPDVTLDDVVFRSMQYANNTLKVVDPQPPFGIPLGPITTATDSDYLHTNPTKAERARSPYIPSCEPDLVTDDLAFRNLRKDAQPSSSSRQPSPSFLSVSSATASPLPFNIKKKRAVRSLSANLYGLINKPSTTTSPLELDSEDPANSVFDDYLDDTPVKCVGRRTSDPELLVVNWQKSPWVSSETGKNQIKERQMDIINQQQRDNSSDIDSSKSSCDASSDERIQSYERMILGDRDAEYKAGSDKGSSYISSSCSTPPPVPSRVVEPVTEQEISVYKKLCQDLENLVQLTKGIDAVPVPSESIAPPPQKVSGITADLGASKSEQAAPVGPLSTKITAKSATKDIVNSADSHDKEDKCREAEKVETSPIKREISTILDNLKSLREDSNRSSSSCSEEEDREEPKEEEKGEAKKKEEVVIDVKKEVIEEDKSLKEITKEICDLAARDKDETKLTGEQQQKEKEEEEERKDRVDDNVFFRNVQLAKLSGDWKESTPNNAVINRRTSLTAGSDNANWEGMNKCNHKYNSMPAKTSSLLPFRHYGSKRKSNNRKSMCSVS